MRPVWVDEHGLPVAVGDRLVVRIGWWGRPLRLPRLLTRRWDCHPGGGGLSAAPGPRA